MCAKRKGAESGASSTTSSETVDRAPDGGWGWVVCFGSFLVNFILDGTMFSFGVLLLKLLEHFNQGKAKTSWIGSSLLGMSMFMGPVVSILLERYTCRQITIVGTLISVGAFIVSVFSPNVEMLIITYGIIGGIGFSMSFISAIIIVSLYFNRKRAIATGIAMSGSGLGTFVYAYLTNYLVDLFDWQGTILILSGILLNGVVCGALFRPLERDCSDSKSNSTESLPTTNETSEPEELKTLITNKKQHFFPVHRDIKQLQTSDVPVRLSKSTDLLKFQKTLDVEICDAREFTSQTDFRDVRRHIPFRNQMSKKDVFYSGSLTNVSSVQGSRLHSLHHLDHEIAQADAVDEARGGENTRTFTGVVKSNLNLFKDKIFVLLLLTNVCWTVQSVPVTYLPDFAVSKGLNTSEAAMLISVVGITNIIGRILSGLVTDVFGVRSTIIYIGALFIGSIVNFVLPWCDNFGTLMTASAVFGLCMATAVSMRTIVLAEHLGMERLTKSFGTVALFQGVAFMTNAPLAGFLYEEFESYFMPFSFAGAMYLLSAIFCLCVQCLDSKGRHNKDLENEIIVNVEP